MEKLNIAFNLQYIVHYMHLIYTDLTQYESVSSIKM